MLGKFIKFKCPDCITIKHLSLFKGSTVVIDISIYLYKYKLQKSLLTNIYLMCSIFKYYNIKPLFVFDGYAGEEKKDELKRRREEKRSAKHEYYQILENNDVINDTMKVYLNKLEKKFIKITKDDITNVKKLLESYGVTYYQASKEADELCAYLIHTKVGDIIISDDMDLFAYGCPIIIRHFDIVNHTCLQYNISVILSKLNMNIDDFKWLCIFAGTDYNSNDKNIFYYYNRFKQLKKNEIFKDLLFKISDDDDKKLTDIFNTFSLKDTNIEYNIKNNNLINKSDLYMLLEKENFIIINK